MHLLKSFVNLSKAFLLTEKPLTSEERDYILSLIKDAEVVLRARGLL